VRERRSIAFYAWVGLAIQGFLVVGVTIFVLAGATYQQTAITELRQRAQGMELANLSLQSGFLETQQALRGYQATGETRFLESYYSGQDGFVLTLRRLHSLAWTAVLGGVTAQAATAQANFLAGDRAAAAPPRSATAARLYDQASASADRFLAQNAALQRRLAGESSALAGQSERTLGIGLPGTSAVLAVGLLLPVIAVALTIRWTHKPLQQITRMVRRRTLGDMAVRAVPGGPADVRKLASSHNTLADASDRLRLAEEERTRLLLAVHRASVRIRGHLHADAVIQEAVTASREHLAADSVWVGLVNGDEIAPGSCNAGSWDTADAVVGEIPDRPVGWLRDMYRGRGSYCVQDLCEPDPNIPAEVRETLQRRGASSLLLAPFGAGPELLGVIALLRHDPARRWGKAEIEAAEYLAEDVGRGLEHARLYEGEERLVVQLQSLDQAKNAFIAAASHDVRTPLTSILGNMEMLTEGGAGPVPPQQAKMLDAVHRNARRLQTLIEDMLTVSKIELGAFTSELRPVDVAGVVAAVADIMRPSAQEKGLGFTVDCPSRGLMVDGDPEQLDRVLINLLSNAVKYTPSGGSVTLTGACDGDSAVLTVADTGMGIPGPDQKSLFTRFFRASNAVENAIPGSGLGLSIVRTVVLNHHGQVDLVSTEGAGTTVTVRLPLLAEPRPGWGEAGPGTGRAVPLPRRYHQELGR
jgi:signal transduction histidine kinase/CHASE3 domain sensor protein